MALIQLSSSADGDFDFLERRWVQIDVQDLDLIFHVSFESGKIICAKVHQPNHNEKIENNNSHVSLQFLLF
ncbi:MULTISPECIES: hypothetical protein [unclassified Agarivorans]|uniref:hypothetical protein n=1 Tax=unclassified Agarivorans TaxID=2636026 RepID=UPI0026E3ACE7|nr:MULTISPECIES: hypothetical protein [unclassified Agarivorans]MDO6683908.1 hypothetical protein [Agarivorans sp. 3_MG-2023]MDO6714359.1 hypothetical protein [Agarivorans sp. 2_MG-2023]